MTKRFELQTDANIDKILLIIDKEEGVMWSFLKDHEEAVQGVYKRLNEQNKTIRELEERIQELESQLRQCQATKNDNGRFKVWQNPPHDGSTITTTITMTDVITDD